jgi:3-dehydroquinate dehydratase-2
MVQQNGSQRQFNILVANGVNLDLLGTREPEIYGTVTLLDIERELQSNLDQWIKTLNLAPCSLHFFQSNSEENFLMEVSKPTWDGILINPAAWTHTSLALADRLAAVGTPYVEVHLSHLARREEFRRHSYTASNSVGVVYGLGVDSYVAGLMGLIRHLMRASKVS